MYRASGLLIDFPLVEIFGTKTLPAVEIVRHWTTPQGAAQQEFVAFLDGDETAGTCLERDAAALEASITRSALPWRQ